MGTLKRSEFRVYAVPNCQPKPNRVNAGLRQDGSWKSASVFIGVIGGQILRPTATDLPTDELRWTQIEAGADPGILGIGAKRLECASLLAL